MSLRGEPNSVWPLSEAVDALAESARQGGVPGTLWISGFLYQGMSLGWTFGATIAWPVLAVALPDLFWTPYDLGLSVPVRVQGQFDPLVLYESGRWPWLVLLLVVAARLAAGLAILSPASSWRRARRGGWLRGWTASKGLTFSAVGLWAQVLLMMFGGALIFIGPAKLFVDLFELPGDHVVSVLLTGMVIALILFYSFLLSILFQIALHSLVQNRRGVGSALLHAWRLAKNDPLATARATIVDAVLYAGVIVAHLFGSFLLGLDFEWMPILVGAFVFVLDAFAGCTRCAYWARAYRALGGLVTAPQQAAGRTSTADLPAR